MPFQFLIPAAAALLGARMMSSSAEKAAQTSASAADRAADVQRQMFERQVELQQPLIDFRNLALNKLAPKLEYQPFTLEQFRASPGYGFRISEGMKALERSAAARGGLLSGATLRGVQRFGQDLASQEFENAFNRYQAERAAELNPLQSAAGLGQTGVNALANAAGQYGMNIGNIGMRQGDVAANALLARGSTYGRALGDIGYLAGQYYGRQQPGGYAPVETRTPVPVDYYGPAQPGMPGP